MSTIESYLAGLFSLEGKTALVTGGGSGVGLMITRALVSAGAEVFIASRRLAVCEEAANSMAGLPGRCIPLEADLQHEGGVASLAAAIGERTDRLHILVNNSGRTWGGTLDEFPWKAWSEVMTLNVTALFTLTRELVPLLKAAGQPEDPARIVNVGSVMGTMPHGFPAYSYSASKAAVHHLTRILANELAGRHVTVNAIAPGPFPSDMTAFFTDKPEAADSVRESVPLARFGTAEDIAGIMLCLCAAGGAYISGAIVPLDGGMTAFRTPGIEQGLPGRK